MKAAIDITEEQRKILIGLLHRYLPDVEVWAYGSRVKWTARPNSDLDLVAFAAPELESQVGELKDALAESDLPFLVDLHTWDDIPKRFHEIIRQEYVVLHERKKEQQHLGTVSDWMATTLGSVTHFTSGGTPSKQNAAYWSGCIPWLSAKDMKSFHIDDTEDHITQEGLENGSRLAPAGTVFLLARGMTLLNDVPICVSRRPMAFNQDVKGVTVDEKFLIPEFLPYLLLGHKATLLDLVDLAGHGTGRLNTDELKGLRISVPQKIEQRVIANVLRAFDDKIELNQTMSETLDAMVRALFQSWFVDFDPVRAKSEGRDPGLPAHVADLFPDRLENSSLGPIPVGWSVVGLDEIANFRNGLALQKFPATENGSLPAIKIAQLRAESTENADRVSSDIPIEYRVEDGDVLFSWSGSLECVVWTAGPGALNQHLFKVTSEQYPKWFFLGWIQHHLPEFREIAAGKATTMGHIQRHHLHDALVAVPPSALIQAVNKQFESLLQASISAMLECKKLVALRDSLLPKLISGELRVNKIVGNVYREEEVHREQYAKT